MQVHSCGSSSFWWVLKGAPREGMLWAIAAQHGVAETMRGEVRVLPVPRLSVAIISVPSCDHLHVLPPFPIKWFSVPSKLPRHLHVTRHECRSVAVLGHQVRILKAFHNVGLGSCLEGPQRGDSDSQVTFDVAHDVPHHPLKSQLWNEEIAMLLDGLHLSGSGFAWTGLPFVS